MNCSSCGVHQRIKWWLRCGWNEMRESVHDWPNEPMTLWTSELVSRCNQWTDESMMQWINDSVNQWINESTNEWISESVSQWINEWTNEWMNEWMDKWATSLLSYFFTGQPALSCLPATSYVASAIQFFSSRSCCNAFSNPVSCNRAYQERCSITHALLRAAVPLRFVTAGCKPAYSRRVALNRPTFAQRWQRDDSALLHEWCFFSHV